MALVAVRSRRRSRRAWMTKRVWRRRGTARGVIRVCALRRCVTHGLMMRVGEVWIEGRMGRGSRKSRRRTRGSHTAWIWITISISRPRCLRAWIWRWKSWRVRLIACALLTGSTFWRSHLGWWRLSVHWLLLVALRWWWILARWMRVRIATIMLRQWLAIRAVELSALWWVLATPDRVRRNESLSLSRNRCEDAFLRKALTIGASAILRLIEAGASNLKARVSCQQKKLR